MFLSDSALGTHSVAVAFIKNYMSLLLHNKTTNKNNKGNKMKIRNKKVGRQKTSEPKLHKINVCVDDQLYNFLAKRAIEADYPNQRNLNIGPFIRDNLFSVIECGKLEIIQTPKPTKDLLIALIPVANNLNQAMHKVNLWNQEDDIANLVQQVMLTKKLLEEFVKHISPGSIKQARLIDHSKAA